MSRKCHGGLGYLIANKLALPYDNYMLKQLPRKLRLAFIGSLIVNAILVVWLSAIYFVDTNGALDFAEIHRLNYGICQENYQRILDKIDQQNADDPKKATALKNSFALNICLRNYKTGERLDVQPLIDQIK